MSPFSVCYFSFTYTSSNFFPFSFFSRNLFTLEAKKKLCVLGQNIIINQYVHIFSVYYTVAIVQVELRLFLYGWGLLYYMCVFFALICWFENYQYIWQYQQIYLFLVNEIIYLKNPGISDPCLLCFSCSHNFQTTLDIATCETSFLSLLLLLSLHCFTESLSSLQLSLISENTEIVPSGRAVCN